MLQVNDYIVFGSTGVCRIADIVRESFGGKPERDYYVLQPLLVNNETIYIPADHQNASIRSLLTREEILALIRSIPEIDSGWIEDDMLRKNTFNEIIHSGDQVRIVQLIKMIHHREIEQTNRGKKLAASDADTMKAAEKLLYNEFALVLGIQAEQVLPFILGEIEG
ncbi:MAG: CarD family transcriptional regulator [Clostridia bacterium]|nr:CarD family transcriptional regulator [Clostridia bacterium]